MTMERVAKLSKLKLISRINTTSILKTVESSFSSRHEKSWESTYRKIKNPNSHN